MAQRTSSHVVTAYEGSITANFIVNFLIIPFWLDDILEPLVYHHASNYVNI